MDELLLGVDGGNTKTIAVVALCDGTIVGWGRAGCGDIYGWPAPRTAIGEIGRAVDLALEMAGRPAGSVVSAAAFSLAGADWPEDFALLRQELAVRVGSDSPLVVVNDAIGALRGGTSDGVGVSVVCGTGHAIGARAPDGRTWHSSFWGRPSGAVELGRAAYHAVADAELGLLPPTALTEAVLASFRAATVEQLLHQFTRRGGRRMAELGRLAPVLLSVAASGDEQAASIVREYGARLGDYACTAAARVGLRGPTFPLVLAGGVFRHPSHLFRDAVLARIPAGCDVGAAHEPAVGALLLAFDHAGRPVDAERLGVSLPPAELFASG